MATPFDNVNNIFYNFVEEDSEFFSYYGLTAEEAEALAQQRADACLMEAAMQLSLEIEADIDFADFDEVGRTFASDLTKEEEYLLARFQYETYMNRSVAKLRAYAVRYTAAEQQVFSPANERRTFIVMIEQVRNENQRLLEKYVAKDRISGIAKELSYELEE